MTTVRIYPTPSGRQAVRSYTLSWLEPGRFREIKVIADSHEEALSQVRDQLPDEIEPVYCLGNRNHK